MKEGSKYYVLAAENEVELNDWVDKLTRAITASKKEDSKGNDKPKY